MCRMIVIAALRKVLASEWKSTYNKNDPGFYDWVEETHDKGQLAPLITINGQIGDGLGRALYFHAIGEDVKVAEFVTNYEPDGNNVIAALRTILAQTPEGLPEPDRTNTHVYRLENKDGEGPFTNRADRDKWQLSGGDWVIPMDDPGFDWQIQDWLKDKWGRGSAPEVKFAFRDQTQYEEYFTEEERDRLYWAGFRLNKTPASQIWDGSAQVFYIR